MRRRPSAPKPTKPVSNVNLDKVRELFAKYAAADDGSVMDMEGISNLSQALSIDPTSDVRILALMWRLGACSKPGQISLSEFEAGMQRLGCETLESLAPVTPGLDPGLPRARRVPRVLQIRLPGAERGARARARARARRSLTGAPRASSCARARAQFNREGTHRTIEKDVIAALLPLAIGDRSQHLAPSVEFLEQCGSGMKLRPPPLSLRFAEFLEQCSTTRITLDQWSSSADFSEKVGPPESGFEGYEEDGAWPLLLDEYVEYSKAKSGTK